MAANRTLTGAARDAQELINFLREPIKSNDTRNIDRDTRITPIAELTRVTIKAI